jgi:hypothetical protein
MDRSPRNRLGVLIGDGPRFAVAPVASATNPACKVHEPIHGRRIPPGDRAQPERMDNSRRLRINMS